MQVGKFFMPNDFVVMDMEEDESVVARGCGCRGYGSTLAHK